MKIVILGAGPTGLGAAWRLKELGHPDFLVVERNDHVGGLAASFSDSAGYTWDFAVHVAHSHYHYVDRLMESVLPGGFLTHERRSWIHVHGTFVPFPFQYNFRHLPEQPRRECLDGLLNRPRPNPDGPVNFRQWILESVGPGIAKHFMLPYNTKLWTVPPEEMGCQWLGDRVPDVDVERVRRNIAENRDDVSWGPNHVFHFPKFGGTGAIWNHMAAAIGRDRIRLSTAAVAIDPRARTIRLSTGEHLAFDHLVSTIPIEQLARQTGIAGLQEPASRLKYSRVQVVCLGLPVPMPAGLQDKTWIYCPDEADVFYRITPFSSFSPAHTPDPARHCSFLCEIGVPGHAPLFSANELARRVAADLNRSGLLRFAEDQAHWVHLAADHGYPIPSLDRDEALAVLLPALEERRIWSRGRFGAWKYEVGNMDHCLMQGVEVVNRILLGEPESTWTNPGRVNAGKH